MSFRGLDKDDASLKAGYAKAAAAMRASENNINFQLIDIKDVPIEVTEECSNQIIIQYKNLKYEILPLGVFGFQIRDYLGIRYYRIIRWSVIRTTGTKLRDIYDF